MTRIFLDVDGVLNALAPPKDHPAGHWGDFQESNCMGFNIYYSPKMGAALAALNLPITWLTTWENQANEWINPLFGWERKPVLVRTGPMYSPSIGWWKADLLRDKLRSEAEPEPFVWIDDDLRVGKDTQFLDAMPVRNLLLRPDASYGITPAQIERIREFALDVRR